MPCPKCLRTDNHYHRNCKTLWTCAECSRMYYNFNHCDSCCNRWKTHHGGQNILQKCSGIICNGCWDFTVSDCKHCNTRFRGSSSYCNFCSSPVNCDWKPPNNKYNKCTNTIPWGQWKSNGSGTWICESCKNTGKCSNEECDLTGEIPKRFFEKTENDNCLECYAKIKKQTTKFLANLETNQDEIKEKEKEIKKLADLANKKLDALGETLKSQKKESNNDAPIMAGGENDLDRYDESIFDIGSDNGAPKPMFGRSNNDYDDEKNDENKENKPTPKYNSVFDGNKVVLLSNCVKSELNGYYICRGYEKGYWMLLNNNKPTNAILLSPQYHWKLKYKNDIYGETEDKGNNANKLIWKMKNNDKPPKFMVFPKEKLRLETWKILKNKILNSKEKKLFEKITKSHIFMVKSLAIQMRVVGYINHWKNEKNELNTLKNDIETGKKSYQKTKENCINLNKMNISSFDPNTQKILDVRLKEYELLDKQYDENIKICQKTLKFIDELIKENNEKWLRVTNITQRYVSTGEKIVTFYKL